MQEQSQADRVTVTATLASISETVWKPLRMCAIVVFCTVLLWQNIELADRTGTSTPFQTTLLAFPGSMPAERVPTEERHRIGSMSLVTAQRIRGPIRTTLRLTLATPPHLFCRRIDVPQPPSPDGRSKVPRAPPVAI